MEEEAKAVQEVAKTARKGLEVTEKFGNFLGKVMGQGFAHLGAAFSDWAQAYRYENLLKLMDKIDSIHKERKIEGKAIPMLPKHAIPILEQASLEDNDDVRLLWAGLIANATDPNKRFEIRKLYIEIISSLDPIDVYILNYLSDESLDEKYGMLTGENLNAELISENIKKNMEDIKISLSNLFRHGLIIDSWEQTLDSLDRGYSGFRVNNPKSNFRLSHLGRKLIDGCNDT